MCIRDSYIGVRYSLYGLGVVNTRANLLTAGELLEVAAVDRYSFVRDAYLQRRRSLVYDGDPPPEKEDDSDPPPEKEHNGRAAPPPGSGDVAAR